MTSFNERWDFALKASKRPVVQNRNELEHIFNMIKLRGAKSYLEIGTAEGLTAYVLAGALDACSRIVCVDFCEPHCEATRTLLLNKLEMEGHSVMMYKGNSRNPEVVSEVSRSVYDVVLIDGDHTFEGVKADTINYAHLANKYVFWHDVIACTSVANYISLMNDTFNSTVYFDPDGNHLAVMGPERVYGYAIKEIRI